MVFTHQLVFHDDKSRPAMAKGLTAQELKPVSVDKTNYKQVLVDSGYYTAEQLK